ncbi:hypothetical protein BMETH_333_2 [methanotrophic bacterial endosymbiont of Bathymodiolus sp.]|nr:hypothetical protein BMETH_333_2 [methanotrophic bacterial endosymbiont of Bathymodiolus sp.]
MLQNHILASGHQISWVTIHSERVMTIACKKTSQFLQRHVIGR